MLESKNYFSKKSEPRCSSATTTLKFRGGGKAAAARLTLSIDEGWSVQHLNSGKYALKKVSRCNTSVLEYMLSLRIPISQKPKLERRFLSTSGARAGKS